MFRKLLCCLLSAVFCLSMIACTGRTGQSAPPTDPTGSQIQVTPTKPGFSLIETIPPVTEPGQPVEFSNAGSSRIPYSINISRARYITSVDQLPAVDALASYDEAFFQTHALILVEETLASSAARVSIDSIRTDGTQAWVTLAHEADNNVTIPTMSAWILWAEVEKGLSYQWSVKNPAMDGSVSDR